MSISTEKATLQVTFQKEKLEALRFYMSEKDLTVEGELQKHISSIYEKYVPSATRRYLERNDNEQENQTETTAPISESPPEVISRTSSNRGRRRAERVQSERTEVPTETRNAEEIEESQGQTEDENQGMVMSM
jgi:hypothetical protein|nr:DUF6103 family protein [Clostridioides sp.]